MSTNFTWGISNLERNTADGIVITVHWVLNARSEDEVYSAGAYGSLALEQPDPETVIPYADLTPETVIQWTQDKLGEEGVNSLYAALEQQLEEQRNPTKAVGVPWS